MFTPPSTPSSTEIDRNPLHFGMNSKTPGPEESDHFMKNLNEKKAYVNCTHLFCDATEKKSKVKKPKTVTREDPLDGIGQCAESKTEENISATSSHPPGRTTNKNASQRLTEFRHGEDHSSFGHSSSIGTHRTSKFQDRGAARQRTDQDVKSFFSCRSFHYLAVPLPDVKFSQAPMTMR